MDEDRATSSIETAEPLELVKARLTELSERLKLEVPLSQSELPGSVVNIALEVPTTSGVGEAHEAQIKCAIKS